MRRDCEAIRERLALLALGALEAERAACEAHIERCAPCREEVVGLRATAGDLVLAAPRVDPPPDLWARLQQRIRDETGPYCHLQLEAARSWIPAGEGVEISQLWVDRQIERHSLLIRMQPGARLPEHRHAAPEECFVLRGDVEDGQVRLRAGDYVRFEAGTQHAVTTRGGCTLLVTASLRDSAVSQA